MTELTKKCFLSECEKLKAPKYIRDIFLNHICLSKSDMPNSFLLYNSKHATGRTLAWRYEKLIPWIIKNGGIVPEVGYDFDKEYCGPRNKYYPLRFWFPSFNEHKVLLSFLGYE